jgi:hypothetical protein
LAVAEPYPGVNIFVMATEGERNPHLNFISWPQNSQLDGHILQQFTQRFYIAVRRWSHISWCYHDPSVPPTLLVGTYQKMIV